MTRSLAVVLAALLVVATTVRGATPAAGVMESAMPAPGPEHERLAAMCGTWDVQMTLWLRPGGAGLTTTATSLIRPLFDGLFIEEKIEGTLNGAPFATLAWTGFNPTTHQYEATRIASTNPARIAETGSYDEKTRQYELKAD